jgi:hypothetical protein
MWRILAILLIGLLPASAQLIGEGVFRKVPAASSFTGPGDQVGSASVYWSCTMAYTAAYASGLGNACDLSDTATGVTTYTMKFLSTGYADFAGAAASSACAVSCSVTKYYDQTGNGFDGGQVTLSRNPVLTFNALGTCATTTYTVAADSGLRNLSFSSGTAATDIVIVRSTSTGSGFGGDLGLSTLVTVNAVPGDIQVNPGLTQLNVAYTGSTRYAIQGIVNNVGTSSLTLNGSTTSGGTGTSTAGNSLQVGRQFDGDVMMMGLWPISFSAPQLSGMNTLLRSYCGGF